MNESGIFETNDLRGEFPGPSEGYHDAVLIATTSNSKLYRVSREGNYFFFKTFQSDDEYSRQLLKREYEVSIGCSHPHVVHVFVTEHIEGIGQGILMEYIEGRNLNEFLAEQPDLPTRKRVFEELLQAVGYLHKRGVVHNDLKPENILVSRNGNTLKLIDFGLSDDDAHYLLKTPGCSPTYSAPELRLDRKSDIRSDIYSLGVIMNLLFGKRYRLISGRCCRQNPNQRYPNIQRIEKSWKRRKYLWILPAILGFLLVSAAAVWGYTRENENRRIEIGNLEEIISGQAQDMQKQQEDYEKLKASYQDTKNSYQQTMDSLANLEESIARHRQLKEKSLDAFRKKIISFENKSLDSLKKGVPLSTVVQISQNLVYKSKKFYDDTEKIVDGEDLSNEMYAIMMMELDKAGEEFNKYSFTYQPPLK